MPLLHLQASSLIKAEQAYRAQNAESSEALRTGAVINNQELLVAAFQREAQATELPVVFDGHSIVDGRDGLIEIPSTVFRDLGLDAICLLVADPSTIAERRRADLVRKRPYRDLATLGHHQKVAEVAARRIAAEIERPFLLVSEHSIELLKELMLRPSLA